MTTETAESRLMAAREMLRAASSAAGWLPALAAMVEVAAEFREYGGDDGTGRAHRLLDESIACLREAEAELAGDDDAYRTALYLRAEACLLRNDETGSPTDLDDAVECLRRLQAALPDRAPDRAEIAAKLGSALLTRGARPGGRRIDLDESGELLVSLHGQMPPDDPGRGAVAALLAVQRAMRFAMFGGTDADRTAALSYATACLAGPADDVAVTGHIVIAWMALARQLTVQQRSAMLMTSSVEEVRLDERAAAAVLARLGHFEIDQADAATALTHLRQVPAVPGNAALHGLVPILWATALLVAPAEGRAVGAEWTAKTLQVADELQNVASNAAPETPATGELHALRAVEQMPRDDPGFAQTLTVAVMRLLGAGATSRAAWQGDQLVQWSKWLPSGLAPDDPLQPLARFMQHAARCTEGVLQHRPGAVDAAIEEMSRHADSVPPGHPVRPLLLAGMAIAYLERHVMGGELRHLEQAEDLIARAFAEITPDGPFTEGTVAHGILLFFRGHIRAVWCYYDLSLERVTAAVGDLERAASLLRDEPAFSSKVASTLDIARVMRDRAAAAPADDSMYLSSQTREAFDRLLEVAEAASPDDSEYPTLVAQAAGGLVLRGLADSDLTLIDRAISLLGEACSGYGLTVRERPRLLEAHGQGLLTRYSLTRAPSDLSNAIDRLEEARRAVEQEMGSPHTASVLQTLAGAYRTRGNAKRGDVNRAVTLGLAGLREHSGNAFLQDTDDNALHIARRGTSDATEMARWFLEHGREAAAVSALELGRGMVLRAATWGAGVEEVLRADGHPGLADEWASRAAGSAAGRPGAGEEVADLRYRVMLAVERSPTEAGVLSPPALADIAAALATAETDALVYLLPRSEDGRGMAVLVNPDATVRWLPLPGLYAGAGSPVAAFLRARSHAEATESAPGGESAQADWLEALAALCGWAWQAAVGPVLDAIPAPRARRERRIVLVPAGELGLVPWHAARRPGRPGRYACHDAIFSYAASAQQFVDAAGRLPRPWGLAPVLIADAAESLYITAAGIGHLYGAHYPAAEVFGYARRALANAVPGSAAATRDDVLAALPHGDFPGATLLHLGCHGQVQVPALASSLTIGQDESGGDARVEVRDILRHARSRRGETRMARESGGLVVLASCLTDVTERDFDEALSLATAFVSAGATGVVAARWRVDDAVTALFMTVFHQLLNGGCPIPARALRETQMWMLNPDREVPDGWPRVLREEAALAGHPGGPDLRGLEAWAGFAYQGR